MTSTPESDGYALPLHVEQYGDAHRRIMLLHRFGANSYTWRSWIGALAKEVRMQFLTEAVVLCCFGGLLGILLALGLSMSLANAIDLPFLFDPVVNIVSFVFSAIMGVIFGYYPAHRASKLDPIDALRHE